MLVGLNVEVDRSVRWISIAIIDYFFNELNYFRYVFCDSGNVIRIFNSECFHIFKEVCFPFFGEFKVLYIFLIGACDDLVVDVRDVHTILNVVAKVVSHDFSDHIIADVVSGMAHVTVGVYCRAACVPADVSSVGRLELFELVG